MTDIPLFTAGNWQMAIGQRAALEGLLSQLAPEVAIEVGTAQGGSLARIAKHSKEVHAFDLAFEVVERPENVVFHEGDSHEELPRLLAELVAAGKYVDFALVDGDHSRDGVKRDLESLLASDAVRQTVIALHDTMNEDVRAGIESVAFESTPKVVFTDLNFVLQFQDVRPLEEMWGGLALVVVDADQTNFRIFDESIVRRGLTPSRSASNSLIWRSLRPVRAARREVRKAIKRALGRPPSL